MTTELVDFFKYSLWANLRLLDACAHLTDAQLDATMKGTYGSVRATLVHIFAGEEGYVQRFTGQRPQPALTERDPFPGFDELRRRAHQSGEALIAIAEHLEHGQVLYL
ncbi:MAG TPA: DinB family protein, partial [Ktedonobacteraceae bacterium]|nr:DinB family protein [Ktedonobacteraceae bacterium]